MNDSSSMASIELSFFKVIATGGTIDKGYSPSSAALFLDSSFLGFIGDALNLHVAWEFSQVLKKDSLEIDEEDRRLILEEVVGSSAQRIVVTHGTDSMIESAKFVSRNLPDHRAPCTVVFTGSFTPGRFNYAEACFNLGAAFAAAMSLSSGVYIAIGGEIFEPGAVKKDHENQRFVRT